MYMSFYRYPKNLKWATPCVERRGGPPPPTNKINFSDPDEIVFNLKAHLPLSLLYQHTHHGSTFQKFLAPLLNNINVF